MSTLAPALPVPAVKVARDDDTQARIRRMGHSMLWVDNVTVSFDGFKALNN